MPRVHTVEKNRKAQKCGKCGRKIEINEGYRHWSFRFGGKKTRCLTCPRPRPSELTQSSYKQQAYGAQEGFEDSIYTLERSDPESFRDAMVELVENVRQTAEDLRDDYQAALDEWEHGNVMIEEKVEAAEEWEGALDGIKADIEGTEPDLPDELEEDATDEEKEEYESEKERAIELFCDEVEEMASNVINDCPI